MYTWHAFFTDLFYIGTIIFLWSELRWVASPKKIAYEHLDYLDELNKKGQCPSTEAMFFIVETAFIVIWVFVGLYTAQWWIFLAFIAWNVLVIGLLDLVIKDHRTWKHVWLHWFNSVVGVIFCLFVIINHYHLHYKPF